MTSRVPYNLGGLCSGIDSGGFGVEIDGLSGNLGGLLGFLFSLLVVIVGGLDGLLILRLSGLQFGLEGLLAVAFVSFLGILADLRRGDAGGVDGQIDVAGDSKYLVIGTLESYEKFVDYYGKEIVVPIYIEVDDRTRIHRAIEREDMQEIPKYSEMCRRFLADEKDFSEELLVKCGIDMRFANYDLDVCVEEILCGIEK